MKDDAGDADVVMRELRATVASKIAKYAVPDQILVRRCAAGPPCRLF